LMRGFREQGCLSLASSRSQQKTGSGLAYHYDQVDNYTGDWETHVSHAREAILFYWLVGLIWLSEPFRL
ncbi:MAG TPA: hypothetical protein VFQ06_14575, partial [Nitrospira sp.]|nr:hypothetical protein [Nitrospira sp.]